MASSIGDKLAALRKEHNMTQSDLGVKLCVSAQAVSKWERGQAEPDIDTLIKVSKIFSITMDELLKGEVDSGEKEEKEEKEEEATLGICKSCWRTVFPSNCGESSPALICKSCLEAKIKKQAEKEEQEAAERKQKIHSIRTENAKELNRGLIWGAVGAIAGFLLMMFLEDSIGTRILYGTIFGYGVFAFISQIIWGNYVADLIVWFLSRTVQWPGIIFTFDLDGLIFLIAMKLLFAALGLLLGIILAVVGFFISLLCASVTFPFSCIAKWREAYC